MGCPRWQPRGTQVGSPRGSQQLLSAGLPIYGQPIWVLLEACGQKLLGPRTWATRTGPMWLPRWAPYGTHLGVTGDRPSKLSTRFRYSVSTPITPSVQRHVSLNRERCTTSMTCFAARMFRHFRVHVKITLLPI